MNELNVKLNKIKEYDELIEKTKAEIKMYNEEYGKSILTAKRIFETSQELYGLEIKRNKIVHGLNNTPIRVGINDLKNSLSKIEKINKNDIEVNADILVSYYTIDSEMSSDFSIEKFMIKNSCNPNKFPIHIAIKSNNPNKPFNFQFTQVASLNTKLSDGSILKDHLECRLNKNEDENLNFIKVYFKDNCLNNLPYTLKYDDLKEIETGKMSTIWRGKYTIHEAEVIKNVIFDALGIESFKKNNNIK